MDAECAFSIRNQLDRSVTSIRGVFIVWDKKGEALHSQNFAWNVPIGPGLAVRRTGPRIDNRDVRLVGRVEARILDFKILD
jgi:hypothetical protein